LERIVAVGSAEIAVSLIAGQNDRHNHWEVAVASGYIAGSKSNTCHKPTKTQSVTPFTLMIPMLWTL